MRVYHSEKIVRKPHQVGRRRHGGGDGGGRRADDTLDPVTSSEGGPRRGCLCQRRESGYLLDWGLRRGRGGRSRPDDLIIGLI